jgi:hypothetical protein
MFCEFCFKTFSQAFGHYCGLKTWLYYIQNTNNNSTICEIHLVINALLLSKQNMITKYIKPWWHYFQTTNYNSTIYAFYLVINARLYLNSVWLKTIVLISSYTLHGTMYKYHLTNRKHIQYCLRFNGRHLHIVLWSYECTIYIIDRCT